jgi:hypothetical protein
MRNSLFPVPGNSRVQEHAQLVPQADVTCQGCPVRLAATLNVLEQLTNPQRR